MVASSVSVVKTIGFRPEVVAVVVSRYKKTLEFLGKITQRIERE
jgi:hypothetical protein